MGSSDKNLVYRKRSNQVFGTISEDLKENLNINIPTKERIAYLDIFRFFKKFQKIYKNNFICSS